MKRFYQKLKNADLTGRSMVICILLVLIIFVAANAMSEPLPSLARGLPAVAPTETLAPVRPTVTLLPTGTETAEPTPTPTPVPPELLENADATNGIIIGTVLLVVIILVGTIAGINLRRKQHLDE